MPSMCLPRRPGSAGFPPLLVALVEQRTFGPAAARDSTLDVCSRFSAMAMIAVTLLVLSGIANAGFRVSGSFGKLFGSAYGDVLLKKIALVGGDAGFGLFQPFHRDAKIPRRVPEGHDANRQAAP